MTTAAELVVKVSADTSSAEGDLRSFSSRMLGGAGGLGAVFGGTLLTAGVMGAAKAVGGLAKGVVGLGASAVGAGAEFAFSMDQVAAVLGATEAEAQQLSDTAVGLGLNPNLKVSTTQAAEAMYSLATAGLGVGDIVGGAAEATVLLANATGGDMTQAAQVATDAMALWGISADQMGESINSVVGVSNASKFDLNDYALALAQGGGVAAMAGLSFEDFSATIAATSSYFSSGSDAGTSLKTMLAQLTPTTTKAKDAMFELGLVTEDGQNAFYDSEGNLKGMYDIVGLLNGATKDLTEQQRKQYLQTIFGNDAMRTAGSLAGMTADEYEAMFMTVNEGTSAMQQATVRTDNLSSAWETFTDTIDAAKTKMGLTLEVPLKMAVRALTPVVDALAGFIQPYVDSAAAWLETNIPILQARIPLAFEAWNTAPGLISGLAAAFAELTGKRGQLQPVIDDLTAMDEAVAAFRKTNPGLAVGSALSGIAAALTGGVAEFDAATGIYTAKWAAFELEISKEHGFKVKVNWDYVLGGPANEGSLRKLLQDNVGVGKTIDFNIEPQVNVKPKYNLAPDVDANGETRQWIKDLGAWAQNKPFNIEPLVNVTPKYDIDPAASIVSAYEWIKDTFFAPVTVDYEIPITPIIDIAAWGETLRAWFGPGAGSVELPVTPAVDWGETWSSYYSAHVKLTHEWVGDVWTKAYGISVLLSHMWEVGWWALDYKIIAKLGYQWLSSWWKDAYKIVVDLIPNWTSNPTGGIPSAIPGLGDPLPPPTGGGNGSIYGYGLPGASYALPGAGGRGGNVVINATVADAIDLEVMARRVAQYMARGA